MDLKVLILGSTGLLGNMVNRYFCKIDNLEVITIESKYRWPNPDFKSFICEQNVDFIINCVGAIHQRTKDFSINYDLPIWLDDIGVRIIHPGTDCEMDDDDYGVSKKRARDYIINSGKNTKIIKTSIIGTEINTNFSLMSWFLSNKDGDVVNGFTNHLWNGNTTLTWSKICHDMIMNWEKYNKETIISSNCVSKFELLSSINNIFDRKIIINEHESIKSINKCLKGDIDTKSINEQIIELKKFLNDEIE